MQQKPALIMCVNFLSVSFSVDAILQGSQSVHAAE